MGAPFHSLAEAAAWYEAWLREAALPLWSTVGVDAATGAFQEKLTPDGAPLPAPRRARVQARQVWVFAAAADAGFGPAYRALAGRGLDAFEARYRRPDGLYVFSADEAGAVVDGTAALYEQAFALLALSAFGRRDAARATRDALQALRHPEGGWREVGGHPFQANAQMHLFEAALAWEMAGDPSWEAVADEIARLALTRFIDAEAGVLREFFDADWRALADDAGGLIEPGHQFEWAYLLDAWGLSRGEGRGARRRPAAL
ncbi:AGE family epimerase/isomerase [Phenylobacterium sp. J367]|uniref:AGE family epimerase/isomerase n=1 Tax=Phenylobacterium sp. J367 TaxID=2898435 RepID=UPI002151E3B5|nr:AGE family epimerase/isomerase [Phenylobacterium sp. J367]MCR5879526.1 AGE family epimerase/isomerase [Phenylobacterium sp. J367]